MAYRCCLCDSISEAIPHFSTFSKNYERRFKGTSLFNTIFTPILEIAEENGLIAPEQIYIDSTHIKASANKKKYKKVNLQVELKKYQDKLNDEIDNDRKNHGKKPLKKDLIIKEKEIIKSTTDEESGMFYKTEKEKCFAYLAHTACDDNNFIFGFDITPGNIHDSVAFEDVYSKVIDRYGSRIIATAIDAGYVTPHIAKTILDSNVLPAIPYKRPMTKKGFFKECEFAYDEKNDCYICPNNKILKYSTTNREGYKEYKSNSKECANCPLKQRCTESKSNQKVVTRHIWQEYLDEANHLRYDKYVKSVYKRRKET
ncbi:transposase, partial [Clostridium baratii]|uniref:transposase n=1 Tax=Clostridium baratii TaxID=1561 RepID=UPI001177D63B